MKSIAESTNAFESMERAGAEQARRADYNHEWALEVERERDSERALADRLARELESWAAIAGDYTPMDADEAIAAWKEARSE